MGIVRIYDRFFGELGVCGNYSYLEYTKEFREAGTAELTVPGSSKAAELFMPDGYISVPDGDIYIINSVERDVRRGEVNVKCSGLLSLFRGTAVGEEYSIKGDAATLLYALVRKGVSNLPTKLSLETVIAGKTVALHSGRSYLYDDLVSLCYLGDVGMKLGYNGETLVFSVLTPRDRTAGSADPVLVSQRMGTFGSERFFWDLGSYRNVAVVSGAQTETGGRYTATVRSDGLSFDDSFPDSAYFDRQTLVNFTSPIFGYMVETAEGDKILDEDAYTEAMIASGAAALGRCRPKLYLYGRTDTDASGILPGDMVDVSDDELGISGTAMAERVVTTYSGNDKTVRTELCAKVQPEK